NWGTGAWSGNYIVGIHTLTGDDHGVPSAVRDSAGFWYVFYGQHANAQSTLQVSSTLAADDPSQWDSTTGLSGSHCFPKAFLVGSNIYLFYAAPGTGSAQEESITLRICTFSSGVLTYGAAVNLIDFANNWCLPGSFFVNGTDIHLTTFFTNVGASV